MQSYDTIYYEFKNFEYSLLFLQCSVLPFINTRTTFPTQCVCNVNHKSKVITNIVNSSEVYRKTCCRPHDHTWRPCHLLELSRVKHAASGPWFVWLRAVIVLDGSFIKHN